jgi:hypothetical protein
VFWNGLTTRSPADARAFLRASVYDEPKSPEAQRLIAAPRARHDRRAAALAEVGDGKRGPAVHELCDLIARYATGDDAWVLLLEQLG